jgi:hypothetical protein
MTDHYDEMRVAPDHSQAEALRQRLHARMASVSRDDHHGRADLHVAVDHLDTDELDLSKEMYMTVDSPTSETRNRKRMLVAAAAVVVAVGVAGIALVNNNSDDDQTPSAQAVATVAPTTTVAPDLSAGTPGLVTGQLRYDAGTTFAVWEEDDVVAGGWRQRGRELHATSEVSDVRLSGSVTVTDNADRFVVAGEIIGDVLWGTVVIENDQGTWTGPLTGTSDLSADRAGITYLELVGAGAYEGLSAIVFQRETATTIDWNGVIFSGNLPPDR